MANQANQPSGRKVKSSQKVNPGVQNGHADVSMVRETSPDGQIVYHAVKKSGYAHERLHALKRISNEMYDAAERFSSDFIKASLDGRYATLDMNRSSSRSNHIMSDSVVEARQRVAAAQQSMGAGSLSQSLSKSCVWYVVGCGETLEKWSLRIRNSGRSFSEAQASGVLISALERLAYHYGLTNEQRVRRDIGQDGFIKGVQHAILLVGSFVPPKKQTAEEALKSCVKMLQNKFSTRLSKLNRESA
jgi:hypothetical protein